MKLKIFTKKAAHLFIYICILMQFFSAISANALPSFQPKNSTLSPAINIDLQSFNKTYLSFFKEYSPLKIGQKDLVAHKTPSSFGRFGSLLGKTAAFTVAPACLMISCLIAALICLCSPGPIFFIQERVGYKGKTFRMLKFRTMTNDMVLNKRRITKLGKILRTTSLDEIPQLINIIKGEMNWFGPRPYVQELVSPIYIQRVLNHTAPGIFSTAISQKGIGKSIYLSAESTMHYDIADIEQRSLAHYLIIFKKNFQKLLQGLLYPSKNSSDIASLVSLMDKKAIDRLNFASKKDRLEILRLADTNIKENGFHFATGKTIYTLLKLIALSPENTLAKIGCLSPQIKENILALLNDKQGRVSIADIATEIISSQIELDTYKGWNTGNISLKGMPTVLLIGPYEGENVKTGSFISPPIGIYRIRSFLQQLGINAQVYDPNLRGTKEFSLLLSKNNFDFLMFSSYHPTYKNDAGLISKAKQLSPHSIIIAGNEGASFSPKRYLKTLPVDAICRGLGEIPMAEMITCFDKNLPLQKQIEQVSGLYFLDKDNSITATALPPVITARNFRAIQLSINFQEIPYEIYWDIAGKNYSGKEGFNHKFKTIRITPDTHCPLECSFCSASIFLKHSQDNKNHSPRLLSAKDIKSLMDKALAAHPDTKTFLIHSDDFLISKKRIYAFADLIEADPDYKNISFISQANVRHADEKILKLLQKIGFTKISYGIESFSQEVLSDMKKRNTPDDNTTVIRMSIDAGLTPIMNIMMGYPTATIEDELQTIRQSVRMVAEGADILVSPLVWALPGTPVTAQAKEFIYETFTVGKTQIKLPLFIKPENKDLYNIIEKAPDISTKLIQEIRKKHSLKHLSPNIKNLIYFLAIHKAANLPAPHITDLLNRTIENPVNKTYPIKKSIKNFNPEMIIMQAV